MRRTEGPFDGRTALHLSYNQTVWSIVRTMDDNQGIVRIEQTGFIWLKRQACGWFAELHALLAV